LTVDVRRFAKKHDMVKKIFKLVLNTAIEFFLFIFIIYIIVIIHIKSR